MFEGPCLNGRFGKTDRETVYRNCQALCTMGRKTWRHGVPHEQNCAVCGDNLAKINMIYHFYAPGQLEYSSIDKMAKYDWSTFRNYVAFLAVVRGALTRHRRFLVGASQSGFMPTHTTMPPTGIGGRNHAKITTYHCTIFVISNSLGHNLSIAIMIFSWQISLICNSWKYAPSFPMPSALSAILYLFLGGSLWLE